MFKKGILFMLFFAPRFLFAQTFDTQFETIFALEVKQIDEFMERFDNNDSTLIKQYYKKLNSSRPLTREILIKSLFNSKRTDWNNTDIAALIKQVDNKEHPLYISFYDNNWFANVNCTIRWNNKPENVTLKLKVQKQKNGGSKWAITDVNAGFLTALNTDTTKSTQPVLPIALDDNAFLNPMSHATDFADIDMVTKDARNIGNYLASSDGYGKNMCIFINECLANHIKVLHTNAITYSLFQIPGWDIEVQQYNRQTSNSGWLICKLIKLPSQ